MAKKGRGRGGGGRGSGGNHTASSQNKNAGLSGSDLAIAKKLLQAQKSRQENQRSDAQAMRTAQMIATSMALQQLETDKSLTASAK